MSQKQPNPNDILAYRRRLKKFDQTGITQCMRILKTIRQLKLQTKMLKCIEMPRVLLWMSRKLAEGEKTDGEKAKLNKMCRFLFKEWREQIERDDLREKEREGKGEDKGKGEEKVVKEKGENGKDEKKEKQREVKSD